MITNKHVLILKTSRILSVHTITNKYDLTLKKINYVHAITKTCCVIQCSLLGIYFITNKYDLILKGVNYIHVHSMPFKAAY